MFRTLVATLPPRLIRRVGRLQHTLPVVGPVIAWFGRRVLAGEGVIRHGIGAGLRFDATGGAAGFLLGTSEPDEQAALARHLSPGGVFYDIGANVGFFVTLAARLVGAQGRVYAFEPNPRCAAQVRRNAALNGFAHVEVVEVAASSGPGTATLHFGQTSGVSSIVGERGADGIAVPLLAIDDFVRERGARPPSLVMIDVEGAEIEVLAGMQATLAAHRPVVMCEIHGTGAAFQRHCDEHVVPLGYAVRPLEGEHADPRRTHYHVVLVPVPR